MATWTQALRFVAKLARLKMTIFSAVTYGVAASLVESDRFDPYLFFVGWTFVFVTQLVAHFFGEFLKEERVDSAQVIRCVVNDVLWCGVSVGSFPLDCDFVTQMCAYRRSCLFCRGIRSVVRPDV